MNYALGFVVAPGRAVNPHVISHPYSVRNREAKLLVPTAVLFFPDWEASMSLRRVCILSDMTRNQPSTDD